MKGKWKSISNILKEKGFHIYCQQCKDKFNDMNKNFKALNDVLGRDTSKVVENHHLIYSMDHIFEGKKKGLMKIIDSNHLF